VDGGRKGKVKGEKGKIGKKPQRQHREHRDLVKGTGAGDARGKGKREKGEGRRLGNGG